MTRFLVLALFLAACSSETPTGSKLSKQPVSIRGWVADVDRPGTEGDFKTVETEAARRLALFQQTSVWIEGAPYVSGGFAETGSFLLLDVAPGNITISFNAPGAETAQLVLQNVPGNADIVIPALLLQPNGSRLLQPQDVKVRVPGKTNRPTGQHVIIAGQKIPIVEVPLSAMTDRRDYPDPGGQWRPVAVVR